MPKKKKKSQDTNKRAKRNSGILEYEIMKIIEACLKQAINTALDDIFKE